MLFLLFLPPQGENSSQPSPAATWHPSLGRESSVNFSSSCGSLPQSTILPATDCSSKGFPQSNSILWVQFPVLVWGPPQAGDRTLLHHWSIRAARAQPVTLPWAKAESLLQHASTSQCHIPLLSQTKETPQQRNLPNRIFPLKYVITEGLTGSALVRGGSKAGRVSLSFL